MLNRKLTGALAWGGLALVLIVPSADILSAKMAAPSTKPAAPAAAPDTITTASVDGVSITVPVVKSTPVPVKGKTMPSYISDPDTGSAPAPVVPKANTQTAVATPELVAPIPMPARMRPLPQVVTAPPATQPAQVAVVQPPVSTDQPLVLDENQVLANEAALQTPVVPKKDVPRPPALVTEGDLEEWDSGSLADYLERRGLLSDASYSEQNARADDDETYDPDGFYLNEGPNGKRKVRRTQDDSFVAFPFE